MNASAWIRELARFAVSGVIVTLVYLLSVFALVEFFDTSFLVANLIAYPLAVALSYLLHANFTFAAGMGLANLLRFLTVTALMVLVIVQVSNAVKSYGFPDYVSTISIPALASAVNYLAYKLWAFAPTRPPSGGP